MPEDRASTSALSPKIYNRIFGYLPRLSILATVCRDWQTMIEKRTFAQISLTIPCLADTNTLSILFRKRNYIRYILFRVDLEQYRAEGCANKEPGTRDVSPTGNRIIVDGFESLFRALSSWEPRGDLVLDIDVSPPSWHQLYFRCHSPWPELCEAHQYAEKKALHHIIDIASFTDEESEMWWWRGLPLVPVVGCVHLGHLSYRQWDPAALSSMLTRFPNMEVLCYEYWRYKHADSYTDERKCLFYPRQSNRHSR